MNLTTTLSCQVEVSDCEDLEVINTLDGFNLQPRLTIPFSGAIDVNTISSETVRLVSLGSTISGQDSMPWGTTVGINQIVWDTFTNTLYVESDALLAQHTRFALIVTRRIRDANGLPVKASDEFRRFLTMPSITYKLALVEAIWAAWRAGVNPGDIVVASVFTTQSATAVLEKIRDQIHAATSDPADFLLGPNGERTVFNTSAVTGIIWNQQTRTTGPLSPRTIDLTPFRTGAVGRLAFGRYRSPDYRFHPGGLDLPGYIPSVPTRTGEPAVSGTSEIYFNLYLPSGPLPPNGWPVAIVGHGFGGSKNILAPNAPSSSALVSALAAPGIASVTMNAVGAGFGQLGTLVVNTTAGASVTFSDGGRGQDEYPRDGVIGANEGGVPDPPRRIVLYSDAFRQTAADLIQLLRVIEVGIDADGDGLRDLDPSRIYFDGGSWSGGYGTVFLGVEPNVRAAVIKTPADPVWFAVLGAPNRRGPGAILALRQPSLLNSPGIKSIDDVAVLPPSSLFFNENFPLRDQIEMRVELDDPNEPIPASRTIRSPVSNSVTGAMAIQDVFERFEWVSQAGSPVAYAPYLRKAPLRGLHAKNNVLYVIFKGDQTAPNPTTTAILRAGELADFTMYYRHDLARLDSPSLPQNPHGFNVASIAPQYLQLDATFFATDGAMVIHPVPAPYFEFPIARPLPEGLNFIVP